MSNSLERLSAAGYNEANESFIQVNANMFRENRDSMTSAIREMALPWKPLACQGGYFMMTDVTDCRSVIPEKYF